MKKFTVVVIILMLVSVLTAGCKAAPPEAPVPAPAPGPAPAPAPTPPPTPPPALPAGTGMLEVRVTDPPPPDMDQIWVKIENLEVHSTGGNWTDVAEAPGEFNLKAIEEIEQFLASKIVDAGKYTQIRLEVESVRIVVGTDEYNATVPSDKIKIVGTFEVEENNTTVITLDFDGQKSVLATGKSNYIFKPVIKLLVSKPAGPPDGAEGGEAGEGEFEGVISDMTGDSWTIEIGGVKWKVDVSEAEIEGDPQVGLIAEVKGVVVDTNAIKARVVEIKGD